MKMSVLASGSTGNSTFIETDKGSVLVDVGLSCKKTDETLNQIGKSLQDINAIFITHEHVDHIKGLKVIAKKYDIPIYANAKTWEAIERKDIIINSAQKFHFNPLEEQDILGMNVQSFTYRTMRLIRSFIHFHKTIKKYR